MNHPVTGSLLRQLDRGLPHRDLIIHFRGIIVVHCLHRFDMRKGTIIIKINELLSMFCYAKLTKIATLVADLMMSDLKKTTV